MPRLMLSLLGPFRAALDEQPITSFRSDKARALLVYLAMEGGRPHAREALAGLLWPDCSDISALAYLRSALSNLRHLLGDHERDPATVSPFLLTTRRTVQLNPAADVWIDAGNLADLLAGHPAASALEQAVALCRGPFLEGFSIGESEAFEEWLLFRREQYSRQELSALQALTAIYIDNGTYARAQVHARRQLALDPWDEKSHQQLMVALALSGQRDSALAHYDGFKRLLAHELSVEPASETSQLCRMIRTEALQAMPPRADDYSRPPLPFVARQRELACLDRHLGRALSSDGRVVFVTGQAGSGKTALIQEFALRAMATERDIIVANGRCTALSALGDPLLPFREIVRMLTGDIEVWRAGGAITPEHARRLWGIVPAAAQAIVEAAPDLIDRFVSGDTLSLRLEAVMPALPGTTFPPWRATLAGKGKNAIRADAAGSALEQTNLFEQVTAFVLALARRQPLLLLLDDLQWADAASVGLLFHLGRRLAGSRVLVVGAYRAEDIAQGRDGRSHPLLPVIHELQRNVGDSPLDLNQGEGRAFIAVLLESQPNCLGAGFSDTLFRHTEGHPLFAVELLRGLQERGNLVRDDKGRWVENATLDWETLPARVEAVIAERISRLPAHLRSLLDAASVEGEEFTAEVIARVQGVDERDVIQHLSGTLSHDYHLVHSSRLQRFDAGWLSHYRFRHHLFWHYLYSQLDEVQRAHLHEATGAAMEAAYAVDNEELAGLSPQLAWHFEHAGNRMKAAQSWRRAGDRAMHLSACEEAIAHYRRGLAALDKLPHSPERAQRDLELQQAMSIALIIARGWVAPETKAALVREYALAQRSGAKIHLAAGSSSLSLAYQGQADQEKALELGWDLLHLARQDNDQLVAAAAHRIIGETQFFRGELQSAREHMEEALGPSDSQALVRSQLRGGIQLDVSCTSFLALCLQLQGYPEQAARWSQKALARAHDMGEQPALAFALLVAGALFHLIRGEASAAQSHTEALDRLSTERGWEVYRMWGTICKGLMHMRAGHVEAGIGKMRQGIDAWESTGAVAGRVQQLLMLGQAYLQAGQITEGLDAAAEALSVVDSSGLRFFEAEAWRLKGALLLQAGDTAGIEAEACLQHAIEIARRQTARLWELRAAVTLARLYRAQGRSAEARSLLAPVFCWFSEGFDTPDLVEARVVLHGLGYAIVP